MVFHNPHPISLLPSHILLPHFYYYYFFFPRQIPPSVDPTSIGLGARSISLGRVAVAAPGDLNASFINPANSVSLESWGLTSMYTSLLEGDLNYTMLGGATKAFDGIVGISYLGGGATGISATTLDANGRVAPTGTNFDYSNSTVSLIYGKALQPKLSAGGTIKLISKGFSGQSNGSGVSLDTGLLYSVQNNLSAGLLVQNIASTGINWATGKNEAPQMLIKGGINYQLRNDISLLSDIDILPFVLRGGIEWKPLSMLSVRSGIENLSSGMNISFGLGLAYLGIKFDYAYLKDGTLDTNSTHFFSFSFLPATASQTLKAR